MSAGLSNPRRSVNICIAGLAIGAAALAWGLWSMDGGEDAPAGIAVAVGLLFCIVFPMFLFNFLWAVRLTDAMQRGEDVIARWTVPPQTLEEFRADEAESKKQGRPNDWKVPKKIPPEGLDVIFSPSAVMIGDTFFGLSRAGLARFSGVQAVPGNPLSLGFGMVMTTGRATSSGGARITTQRSELRVPVARTASAEASKVIAHYTAVTTGQTVARPGFWALRLKIGLWAAAIAATTGIVGFALRGLNDQLANIPLVMAIAGTMFTLGGLLIAAIAALIQRAERTDRTRR